MSALIARRQFLLSSLAMASASVETTGLVAQTRKLGDRPIKIIVPFAAGGGVDVFARLLSEKLRQKNGLTIIVDNRGGANGSIGGNAVRTAEPDGTTLLFSAGTHVMARQVMKNAPYDPVADFAPIALAGSAPLILAMAPNRPEKTLAEVVAAARANPAQWTIGVPSLGAAGTRDDPPLRHWPAGLRTRARRTAVWLLGEGLAAPLTPAALHLRSGSD